MKYTPENLHSNYLTEDYCLRNSLLISILDGSIIDLKEQFHTPKKTNPQLAKMKRLSIKSMNYLGKRDSELAFKYVPTKCTNSNPNTLRIEDTFAWNFSSFRSDVKHDHMSKKVKKKHSWMESVSFEEEEMSFLSQKDQICSKKNISKDETRLFGPMDCHQKENFREFCSKKINNLNSNVNDSFDEIKNERIDHEKDDLKMKFKLKKPKIGLLNKNSNISESLPRILEQMQLIFHNRKNESVLIIEKKKLKSLLDKSKIESCDLSGLSQFLKKFLNREPITLDDLKLSDLELILFCLFIIKKKFKKILNPKWNKEYIENLRISPTQKTSEQNYKIIFKKFFKLIINDFNKKNNLELSDNTGFYKHHFETIATSLNQDWRNLRFKFVFNEYRNKKLNKKGRHSKKEFARVLKKSEEFMSMFNSYLNDSLQIEGSQHGIFLDYWPIIESKLKLLIERWRTKFCSNKNIKSRLCNFLVAQMQNDKIKLPWGFGEIQQAILNVKRLFNRVR
jgi:hypothetical protein